MIDLLARPHLPLDAWFARIATGLMDHTQLVAGSTSFRLRELEVYLWMPGHRDPFAHRDPSQAECGTWYFHRSGASFRGGSFKGVDLTFGGRDALGGILVRSLSTPTGFTNGSSLCVDALLDATGAATVAHLHRAIGGRSALDPTSPLHLAPADPEPRIGRWPTARVGLTLKRVHANPDMPTWLGRPYRILDAPRAVRKGRVQLVCALHAKGVGTCEVHTLTGSPPAAVRAWTDAFDRGLDRGDPLIHRGISPTGARLAHLLGAVQAGR